jgi:hypothetical protein
MNLAARPVAVRMLSKIYIDANACWRWAREKDRDGYGRVPKSAKYRGTQAHRVSYEVFVGPIPAGLTIDHLCRVRDCINPGHLEPVTHAENCSRARRNHHLGSRSHCKNGHPYDEANTRMGRTGRVCKTCIRINVANYKARKSFRPQRTE